MYYLPARCYVTFDLALSGPPEAPLTVRLSVTGSTSLTVSFQEPASMNSAVVTKYKGQCRLNVHLSVLHTHTHTP